MNSLSTTLVFLVVVALCMQGALAHTYLSSVFLNNQALNEGDCVRPHPSTAHDYPIPLLTQPDMTCGWLPYASQPANRKCPIAAGQTIGLQWHHNYAGSDDDFISPTHVGPLLVYLAKSDTGAGNVWFKVYEDGYTNGQWAVTKLVANKGRVDITIPADIAPGNYLLRGEILALHNAYSANGVQPYVGCVELTISGTGTSNPSGVAFPGYYTNTAPGMIFDIYSAYNSYTIPGPALYKSASSSSGSANPTSAPPSNPTYPPAYPTYAPTQSPPSYPTYPPTPSNGNIKVGLSSGTSTSLIAVIVSDSGSDTTVKVEIMDYASINVWTTMIDMGYAYTYGQSTQISPPLSLRLTSSTGKQVVLMNIFTSLTPPSNLIDTGKTYATSTPTVIPTSAPTLAPTNAPTRAPTSAPTSAPTNAPTRAPTSAPTNTPTSAPTSAPTNAPTRAPTSAPTNAPPATGNTRVTLHVGSSSWWLGLMISGNSGSIATVELKDAGSVTSFSPLAYQSWGAWTLSTTGNAFVGPITVRITSTTGKVATAIIANITPGSVTNTDNQL